MKKEIYLALLGLLFLSGCGGDSSSSSDNSSNAIAVYNQAYQQNYEEDSISEIVTYAKDAYVLVDPFLNGVVENIESIKSNNNQVSGYISIGTGEEYRDDFVELEPYLTTIPWNDWSDEYFVSETTTGIIDVMKKRIDKMANWGLDWVEFDNMDWLDENSSDYNLKVTSVEAVKYVNTLCEYTHQKGMKCMAKNIVKGFDSFDGVLYESFNNNKNWWDKAGMKSFLDAGKLVIVNHYNEKECDKVYKEYTDYYHNIEISFICEDSDLERYKHYRNGELI